jgi:hypothetical protein
LNVYPVALGDLMQHFGSVRSSNQWQNFSIDWIYLWSLILCISIQTLKWLPFNYHSVLFPCHVPISTTQIPKRTCGCLIISPNVFEAELTCIYFPLSEAESMVGQSVYQKVNCVLLWAGSHILGINFMMFLSVLGFQLRAHAFPCRCSCHWPFYAFVIFFR